MVNSPVYSGIIDGLESERRGYAGGGMVASVPSLPPSIRTAVEQESKVLELIMAVNNRIDNIEVSYTDQTQKQVTAANKDRIEIKRTGTL